MSKASKAVMLEEGEDEDIFEEASLVKSALGKKRRPNMDEADLPEGVTEKKCRARETWLRSQLPISVRFNIPGLIELVATLEDFSPNLRKTIFEFNGEEHYDLTSLARAVHEHGGKAFNPKSIKAWEVAQFEVRDGDDTELVWSAGINVIPSEYRGPKAKVVAKPATKKSAATTKKSPAKLSSKIEKTKTSSKKSPSKKAIVTKKTSKSSSTKKSSAKRKAEESEEEEEVKPKKKTPSTKKSKKPESENKLSTPLVMGYHRRMEDSVEVSNTDNQTALQVLMKFNLNRVVNSFSAEDVVYLAKKANGVLAKKGRKLLSIPSEADVESAIPATDILPAAEEDAPQEEVVADDVPQDAVVDDQVANEDEPSTIDETQNTEEVINEETVQEKESVEDENTVSENEQSTDTTTGETEEFVASGTEEAVEDQVSETQTVQDDFVSSQV
jgi:hypothetical protein